MLIRIHSPAVKDQQAIYLVLDSVGAPNKLYLDPDPQTWIRVRSVLISNILQNYTKTVAREEISNENDDFLSVNRFSLPYVTVNGWIRYRIRNMDPDPQSYKIRINRFETYCKL